MGDNDKVKPLLMQIVSDGNSPGLLSDLISLVNDPVWSARSIIRDTLVACIASSREVGGTSDDSDEPSASVHQSLLVTINHILTAVHEHVAGGGSVVNEGDVTPLLRAFCADDTVAIQPRLDTLELMEKTLSLSDDDLGLLMLYRTNAVVSHCWPDLQLTEADVNNNASRVSLFDDLLSKCESLPSFKSLIRLLQIWPTLKTSTKPDENCWVRTFRSLLQLEIPESVSLVITTITEMSEASTTLDTLCTSAIASLLSTRGHFLAATQVSLLMYHESLRGDLEHLIQSLSQSDADNPELSDLILHRHLTAHIATTQLFPNVVKYLLSNQEAADHSLDHMSLEGVARELKDAGYDSEAGFLLLKSRTTHPLLQTFSSARSALSKWLYK